MTEVMERHSNRYVTWSLGPPRQKGKTFLRLTYNVYKASNRYITIPKVGTSPRFIQLLHSTKTSVYKRLEKPRIN